MKVSVLWIDGRFHAVHLEDLAVESISSLKSKLLLMFPGCGLSMDAFSLEPMNISSDLNLKLREDSKLLDIEGFDEGFTFMFTPSLSAGSDECSSVSSNGNFPSCSPVIDELSENVLLRNIPEKKTNDSAYKLPTTPPPPPPSPPTMSLLHTPVTVTAHILLVPLVLVIFLLTLCLVLSALHLHLHHQVDTTAHGVGASSSIPVTDLDSWWKNVTEHLERKVEQKWQDCACGCRHTSSDHHVVASNREVSSSGEAPGTLILGSGKWR